MRNFCIQTNRRQLLNFKTIPDLPVPISNIEFNVWTLHLYIDILKVTLIFSPPVARGQSVDEHIVVGTPGKVLDWVKKYKCLDLSQCRVFVLDEADVMIATQGHQVRNG